MSTSAPRRFRSTLFVMLAAAVVSVIALAAGAFAFTRRPMAAGLAGEGAPADSIRLADSARRVCRDSKAEPRTACYEGILVPLVASHGVRVAMGTLNQLGANDHRVITDGHVYAHAIGIAAGKMGGDAGTTFASCTETFQSGCYHGVIQAYFENLEVVDAEAVNALCRSYTGATGNQWLRFQCVHGMGHGLMMVYAYDLPLALEACDLLRERWDRESCYGGGFMENVIKATAPHHPASQLGAAGAEAGEGHHHHPPEKPAFKALDPNDLLYPCSVMPERYLIQCYQMQTSVMLHFTKGDIAAAARTCLQAPAHLRAFCHQSLGRDITAYARQQRGKSIEMCSLADPEYQPWCHFGVAKNFIDIGAREEDGIRYCREVPGQRNKFKCYEAVGEQIGTLMNKTPDRAAACAKVEEKYRGACAYGARLTAVRPSELSS